MFSLLVLSTLCLGADTAKANPYFTIRVVDEQTGRGVPLVELRTVHAIRLYTDSNGVAAFHEPGLMGKEVYFGVSSHGYEFPKDGFGLRGKRLRVTAGGSATLKIRRLNLAERLYRVTGAGIYRDSVLVGEKVPLREPVLNGLVLGSDSVLNAVHRGKIYWFWGDTNRPSYPLGNFHVPGATSALPGKGGLDPAVGVDLTYWVDEQGFAKPTMKMPGKGPTWLTALVPLQDRQGRERLYGSYVKVEPPLKIYARGLAVFDDDKNEFEPLKEVDLKAPLFPTGHGFVHREEGIAYVYFAHPYPLTRVRATVESFQRLEDYEAYTCLKAGTSLDEGQLDRDSAGKLRYSWKKQTSPVGPAEQNRLIAAGKMKQEEGLLQLRERDSGKAVLAHGGSVCWNKYRQRWVLITVQAGGTSYLGEVWYAEADSPVGPWRYAVKVVTHERYSFYNPKQHPMFDQEDGRVLFFEGTYTHTFSGNAEPTPRYDYNQILYRLDLSDARAVLPVPVYNLAREGKPQTLATGSTAHAKGSEVAFFAPDRPFSRSVPVVMTPDGLAVGKREVRGALFYALPPDTQNPPATMVALYEYRQKQGARTFYSIDPALNRPGWIRADKPLCLVWR